jgi:hypothetical protein
MRRRHPYRRPRASRRAVGATPNPANPSLRAKIASPKGLLLKTCTPVSKKRSFLAIPSFDVPYHSHSLAPTFIISFIRHTLSFTQARCNNNIRESSDQPLPTNHNSRHVRQQNRRPPLPLRPFKQCPCHSSCMSSCGRQPAAKPCKPYSRLRYQRPSSPAGDRKHLR